MRLITINRFTALL